MNMRVLTIHEDLVSHVFLQYFAFRNTSTVVSYSPLSTWKRLGLRVYTQERMSEHEHGVPLNQTSNRGACRANEIHRSTQL